MSTCDLRYVSHKMYEGKPKLEGLPATFATEESGCSTLEITMYDKYADIEVVLIYTAFDKLDVITRSAVITNKSEKPFKITRALSACVDFDTDKMDMITLNGSWARERALLKDADFTMVNSLLIPAGANHHIRTTRSLLFATITLTRIRARCSVSTSFIQATSMLRQKLLSIRKLVSLWV